jgi:lipopolysaccharide biosynthesis glycosyltransferase
MKYVYVLASDESDCYYEQALMSITSLKIHTPKSFVSLLVDDITEKTLVDKRRNIIVLVDELKVVEIPRSFGKKARSRWLKTTMREHIVGDFLYIDSDTVVVDDISDIISLNIDLGAVPDSHVLFNEFSSKDFVQMMMKRLEFNFNPEPVFYSNGGLFFSKDIQNAHDFFFEWHRLWLLCFEKNVSIDQPALNQANINFYQCIKKLDDKWNVQILTGGLPYLSNAKIIHYFSSNDQETPFLLARSEIYNEIRKCGITENIMKKLVDAKSQFSAKTRLISDTKVLLMLDSITFFIRRPVFLNMLHSIVLFFRKIKNKFERV